MAAAALESLTIPRPRPPFVESSAPRAAAALVSASLGHRVPPLLPEFRGLRIARRSSRAASAVGPAIAEFVRRRAVICESQDTAMEVPDVTKSTWQSLVMDSDSPVLVEFWASWCGPCQMIHPVIAKLSKTYERKLKCFKLNTDESPDIATQYGIRSIPTIIIFKNGVKKDAVIGAVPESTLVRCIEKFVESNDGDDKAKQFMVFNYSEH